MKKSKRVIINPTINIDGNMENKISILKTIAECNKIIADRLGDITLLKIEGSGHTIQNCNFQSK